MKHGVAVRRMRDVARLKHLAYSTEKSYISWFSRYFRWVVAEKRGTDHRGNVEMFLTGMARDDLSAASQNQAVIRLDFRQVIPHYMWHEIQPNQQDFWDINCNSSRHDCQSKSNAMDLSLPMRSGKKRDDSKPNEWKREKLWKGRVSSKRKTWQEKFARILRMDLHETAMPKSSLPGIQPLGWQGHYDLRRLENKLSGISGFSRRTPNPKTYSGQNQFRWKLRAWECSMGTCDSSTKQQAHEQGASFPWRISNSRAMGCAGRGTSQSHPQTGKEGLECGEIHYNSAPPVLKPSPSGFEAVQDARDIQAVMGHNSLETTMGYLHPEVERIESPIEAMELAGK